MERDSRRIDELFRQHLDPLRVSPPPMAWDRLADALDEGAGQAPTGIPLQANPGASGRAGWMRRSWTGIAMSGLLLSGLFLAPERIGYNAVNQQVVPTSPDNYLKQENEVSVAPASFGNFATGQPGNSTLEQAGFASAQQAPERPAPAARRSDISAAQEYLMPIAAAGFERGSLAHLEALAPVQETTETPTIADQSLAAAPDERLAAEVAEEAAALAFPPAATVAAVDAPAAPSAPANTPTTTSTTTSTPSPATRTQGPSPWDNVYGGVHGSMQWTGLLSQNNAQPDENLDPMLNIGYAFGLHAGYRFNPRISLETGLVLNSMQGSRYESSVDTRNEEVPVTKALKLHYTQVPLTVRISPGRNPQGGMPEGWSYVGGLQYGMLRTSKLRIEDRRVNPERNLQEHDLAVLLGMDYNLPLNDQLFLTLGFRGSLGLNQANVTTVEGINSDKRNAVLGFRAAFNGFLLPQ